MEKILHTPDTRAALAHENFKKGYNCAQSVILTFADKTGIDETALARLAGPFGGGMGRMREVCGAVSGALMILGLVNGYEIPGDADGKAATYALVRDFAERFRGKCGCNTILCRELLSETPHTDGAVPEERTPAYYKRRPCAEYCACAAYVLSEMLGEGTADTENK